MGSSYGIGQGFAQGIQSLIPIAANKMRMDQQNKQFYDQLAVRAGWQEGRMGKIGLLQDPAADSAGVDQNSQVGRLEVPGRQMAVPQPAPSSVSPGMALAMPANSAPRMPNPVSVRGGRRLF